MTRAEVAVIGAGPAGLAAAALLAERSADVMLIDEQVRQGGQIFRQPPETFVLTKHRSGKSQARGHALLASIDAAPQRKLQGTSVWGVFEAEDAETALLNGSSRSRPWTLGVLSAGRLDRILVDQVLVATGAFELAVSFPGWTLPGVMTAGGVQSFIKAEKLVPGRRFVLAGAHPLLLLVADQLLAAGGEIAAVAFAQSRPEIREALTTTVRLRGRVTHLGEAAAAFLRLRRAGVRVLFSHVVAAAEGTQAVTAARLRPIDADWLATGEPDLTLGCDTLAVGYGLIPATELTRQAGCAHSWRSSAGGWTAEHDAWQATSKAGISVAGEVSGVAGAEEAEEEGRLAALGILKALGRIDDAEARRLAAPIRRRLRRHRRFSAFVQERFAPRRDALALLAQDETLVCRCEEVTAGQLRTALATHKHIGDVDAVKQLLRVGMGPCQGRFCHATVAAITADIGRRQIDEVGAFTARPPAKPLRLGHLADAATRERGGDGLPA